MSAEIHCRAASEADIPALCALWEATTGWGALDEATYRRWYLDTPEGPCLVVLGETGDGEVVAQLVFTPARLRVAGVAHDVRALRVSAPILARARRRLPADSQRHPVLLLLSRGLEIALERGFGVYYSMPDAALLPFVPHLPGLRSDTFDCVGADAASLAALAPATLADEAPVWDDAFAGLWERAADGMGAGTIVIRSPEWLRYRCGKLLARAVRAPSGRLIGYAAFKRETGLLADLLAERAEDLAPVLAAAVRGLRADGAPLPERVNAMRTPLLAPVLDTLPFAPVDYRFAFFAGPLDPALPETACDPRRWFAMPGD